MSYSALQALVFTGIYPLKPRTFHEKYMKFLQIQTLMYTGVNWDIIKLLFTFDKFISLLIHLHMNHPAWSRHMSGSGWFPNRMPKSPTWSEWSWRSVFLVKFVLMELTSVSLLQWLTWGFTCEWSSFPFPLGPRCWNVRVVFYLPLFRSVKKMQFS